MNKYKRDLTKISQSEKITLMNDPLKFKREDNFSASDSFGALNDDFESEISADRGSRE